MLVAVHANLGPVIVFGVVFLDLLDDYVFLGVEATMEVAGEEEA